MSTDAAATPSPPPGIRTPPAPRLGFHDSYEPYSPRKSARISSQRPVDRTPSPSSSHRKRITSPRASHKANARSNAALVSPMPSPRKKRQPAPDSSRRVSGALTSESIASASAAIGLDEKMAAKKTNASLVRASGSAMLPTPSKTPSKKRMGKTTTDIDSFARNLFPSEETGLPSPQKKRTKKYSGMTMESFTVDNEEDPIEIFTDSQDRIPEKDDSASNPFYGDATAAMDAPSRRSKRRQVMIPGEGVQQVEEASRREDGMVYVFRGKKFFRKFSENESQDMGDEQEDLDAELGSNLIRPLTRSSVKPRLLFQTEKTEQMLEDEEAATDVEDEHMEAAQAQPQTPIKAKTVSTKTPEAPKYAPISPPETKRTTRSTNKLDQGTPMKKPGRRGSLFDSWPRTKEHKEQSAGKRQGETLPSAPAKRSRA